MTISLWNTRLKTGCAVGFAVVIVAGWFSGSYSIRAHRERYYQLQELRVQNWELAREISEKKNHLAALERGELPIGLFCTLPKLGHQGDLLLPRRDESLIVIVSASESSR